MPDSENENGRTHEPSFRELVAEIDGLKIWISAELRSFDKLMGERDRRYSETASSAQRAVDAALAALQLQTKSAFDSAEKAITKAEQAQTVYNQTHNDVQRQRVDAEKLFAQRSEVDKGAERVDERIEDLKKAFENYQTLQAQEIRSLRESRSEEQGHGSGISQSWAIVAVVAALIIDVGARFIR